MKRILLLTMVFFSIFSHAQFPEGFEGATFPPTGWVVEDNGVGTAQSWGRTNAAGFGWVHQGAWSAMVNRDGGATSAGLAQDWLITPQVTVPTNGQIRFYSRSGSNGEQGSVYKVLLSTTGQSRASFTTTLATYTELDIENLPFKQMVILLNAYAGQNVYFAFVMEVNNGLGDRWILDDVKVDQQCLTPTALNVTPFSTTANLSWTSPNPAGPWQIEYGPQGFVQGTGTIVNNILTNSHTLTGLSPLTSYSYYVRTICEADNVSPWSVVRNFTTTVAPPICGGNFVDPGGATGSYPGNFNNSATPVVICPTNAGEIVTVTFSSFNTEPNWDALYVYDGPDTSSPLISSGNPAGFVPGGLAGGYWGTTIPGPFTSTHPSGCLTFVFRSDGFDSRDGWISNISCSTCPPPARVNLVTSTSNSLQVSWVNLAPLATSFEVIWLPAGSPPPNGASTGQIVTGSSYVIPSLNSLTTYDVYVRPICSSVSTTGNWSVKGTFTTLPDFCAGDHFYDLGGATANYPNNVTATNGGTTTICAPNPGDFVTVFFNSFDISNDILNIYDGNSNASTLVNIATGNTVIESLQSTGNCLTFEFLADGVNNAAGWDASIVCGPPCPSIISTITNSVPAIATDGKLRICKNQNVQFSGGSTTSTDLTGATYIWKFDDGVTLNGQTVSRTFANEGIYFANLTIILPNGCRNTNKIQQLIYVSPEPIFTTTISDNEICANQTATLSVNQTFSTYTKVCEVPLVQPPLVGDLVGVVRILPQFINCYEDSAVITSASDIVSVCINMEHSFMGDFRLRLISPAGQVIILKNERGNGATNGRYLGCPIDPGAGPGTFRQYCFTPTATLLIDDPAVPTTVCGNVAAASVVAGSYRPLQSFNGFIGSSVNGLWRLEFMDDWAIDDGYIQQWSIEFNPAFIPANYQFTPVVQSITWDSNPDIISTSGNQITVNPLTPGNKCYTYNVTNDFGCTYSQQVCLDVIPGVEFTDITASPTQICNGGDGVYTFSGTPNAIVTYNINGGANQTITLDGTGSATLTLTGLNLTTDINVTYMTAPSVPTAGNAITTVGGVNPNNSTGAILAAGTTANTANSTTINSSNTTVTLTLAHVVPAGTPITVSLAKNTTTGAVNIVDGPSTLLFNTGAINILQHVTFIKGTTSNTITINRANGTVFLDGVSYNYNELGCDRPLNDSASIVVYATPIVSVTPATCTANGSAIITNYNPAFTYVFNPLGPSIDASGAILNATFGTSYTVALDNVACLTSPSPFVIDAILQNLPTPIVNTTPPTCLADGFSTITNYDGTATYTFTPAGPFVDATGLITGMILGNSYTVIASNTTCDSNPSTPFSNLVMLVTPVVPIVSVTPPTCAANGFATITNYDPAIITYVFTPAGPTVDATGLISGMLFATNYEVAASNGSCTSINSAIFTISQRLPQPTIFNITNNGPICIGSTATFTINATPNSQVDYSVDGNPVQTVAINSSGIGVVNVAGVTASTTINTISIFDGICSSNIALNSTVSLFADTTISLVSPTSTENQTRCAGVTIDPIHYQVIGTATGVTVTGLPIGVTHNYNASTGLLTISGAVNNGGVYNYFITTSGGCNPQAAESGSITITPRPTLTYTVTNTVCDGSTLDFVLSSNLPNTTFSWSATVSNISGSYSTTTNGDETNINQIATLTNPENVGTITMIIIPRANGCDGIPSNPITITVNPNPVIESVTVSDSSVCSATNATNNVHVDIVGNISGITYTWTAITNGVTVVGGVTSGTITATSTTAAFDLQVITSNPLVAGTIYFEVSSVRNGCPGNTLQSGVVTVSPNPGLPISSPIKTICSGNNTDLIVDVSPLIAGTELTWEVLTVVNVSGATPGTGIAPVTINDALTATTNTQGYVIYRVRSSLGECQGGYTDYRVNVNPAPLPKLVDGNICITAAGEVYQTYTLNTSLNNADYDFEWFDTNGDIIPGATSSTLVVDEAGTYSVIATNWLTGCSSDPLLASATATVTETLPATSMTIIQSEYFSDNATITVNVTGGSGTLMYSLDEGSLQSSNVFTGVSAGEHLVTVIDTEGCTFMTQKVNIIDYPNYFTPNGDGINDTWNISGLNQADAKLYIFDRYGKLIKQLSATDDSEGWDGTYNQELLPSTDYWFSLDYTENGVAKQFKAHFSLIR